jgi:hypothetical protein
MRYHLAQLNIARLAESLDHPSMSEFVALLEPVNAAADDSPGFVWRLPTEEGNATSIRAFDGEAMLVNLTVWESLDALYAFTYRGDHLGPLRRRREWLSPRAPPRWSCGGSPPATYPRSRRRVSGSRT